MNQSILRGFCQKCGISMTWERRNRASCKAERNTGIPCNTVWFLSPKQIIIVIESAEFHHWYLEEYEVTHAGRGIAEFLDKFPFLVAKILKESEGK